MTSLLNFNQFCSLLVSVTNWDSAEEFKETANELVIKQTPVDKKLSFEIELRNGEKVVYAADQLAHFYRTRELSLRDFVSTKTVFKKISVAHRSILSETINRAASDATTPAAAGKPILATTSAPTTTTTTTTTTSVNDDVATAQQQQRRSKQSAAAGGPRNLHEAQKLEVCYYDRNAALNATRSFQEVIDIDSRSKKMGEDSASTAAAAALLNSKRSKRLRQSALGSSGTPIIVVPPNSSAVINLYNCRQFLEDSTYVSYADLVKQNDGQSLSKPECVYVTRKKHPLTGYDLRFKVVDSVLNFDDETWDRVVAVIVSGQAWQLKGWKWPNTQEIFAHVKGLYVYFDDAKLPQQVQSWNVAPLAIKHHLRNKDIIRVHELWTHIDTHLSMHHPKLLQGLIEEAEIKLNDEREARKKGMQAQLELDEEEEQESNAFANLVTAE